MATPRGIYALTFLVPELVTIVTLILMVKLGFWQFDRASQKDRLQAVQIENQQLSPCSERACLNEFATLEGQRGRRVELDSVELDQTVVLLDNQVRNGRPGYVIAQRISDSRAVLLRGWIAAPALRDDAILVPQRPAQPLRAMQTTVPSTGVSLRAPPLPEAIAPGVYRAQRLADADLAAVFGATGPWGFVQETGEVGDGLDRHWLEPKSGADRHRAYAVQWFTMAAVLAALHAGYRWKHLRSSP